MSREAPKVEVFYIQDLADKLGVLSKVRLKGSIGAIVCFFLFKGWLTPPLQLALLWKGWAELQKESLLDWRTSKDPVSPTRSGQAVLDPSPHRSCTWQMVTTILGVNDIIRWQEFQFMKHMQQCDTKKTNKSYPSKLEEGCTYQCSCTIKNCSRYLYREDQSSQSHKCYPTESGKAFT